MVLTFAVVPFMAQLDTTCPVCGAQYARKLSVVHAEGISIRDAADLRDKTFQCGPCGERFVPTEAVAA